VTLICDAGAFVALERNDRAMWRRLKAELRAAQPPVSHGGVVAQVWRGGARQALLARTLSAVEISVLDDELGRKAGALLGRARARDAIGAAVVALAVDDDRIVTSDPGDIHALVAASGVHVDVIPV
jgi:hypothetical protein